MVTNDAQSIRDGQISFAGGMDASRSSRLIGPDKAAFLSNLTTRGGYLTTRPGVYQYPVTYRSEDAESAFETGRWQMASVYRSSSGKTYLITSVSGKIIMFDVSRPVPEGFIADAVDQNLPDSNLAWITQAGNYAVIQDGSSNPLIVSGTAVNRVVPNSSSNNGTNTNTPAGEEMAFGINRLVVSINRQYFVGDFETLTNPERVLQFSNQTYFEDGGGFIAPISMGDIMAMQFMAMSDTATGQGQLFILGQYGAISTNLNVPREDWATTQLQTVTLIDIGGTGPYNLVTVNNDFFWRAPDGIRSYRQARSEESGWSKHPISAEIAPYIARDAGPYLKNCSSAFWNNYLLTTSSPQIDARGIYFETIAVLDFQPISGIGGATPPAWCGFWSIKNTKILQVLKAVVDGRERCFVFTRDVNNKNRLCEFLQDAWQDNTGENVPIEWEYVSRSYDYSKTAAFKKLMYLDAYHESIKGEYRVQVSFRNDLPTCWTPWHSYCVNFQTEDCTEDCQPTTPQPGATSLVRLPECPDTCDAVYEATSSENTTYPILKRKARMGYEHQIKLTGSGHGRIYKTILHARIEADDQIAACSAGCTEQSNPCCPQVIG